VIGDSLTDNSRPWLVAGLRDAGFTALVDAQPSRRIPARVSAPYSGVRAALGVRSSWSEADCWMIALGSNDLVFGAGVEAEAVSLIDEMLGVVSPGARVWWINLNYHTDPDVPFGFPGATEVFNRELDRRAFVRTNLVVLDWFALSESNPEWFFDPVHVDRTGSIARAEFMVAALPHG